MSHQTAITRSKPSAPAQWLHSRGLLLPPTLDYGCGRGKDADTFGLDRYDPHWFPERPTRRYRTAICIYVLNVVPDDEPIITDLAALADTSYVAVRRDLPPEGRQGRGCWQRYVRLPLPVIHETKAYAIYRLSGCTKI